MDAAFNLARHLARDDDVAADIVQDAYLRALRLGAGFRGENPRGWLLTIVRRTFYSQWQQSRTVEHESFDEELHGSAGGADGPEAALDRTIARQRVYAALGRLPAPYREVLVLRELEELTYEEIARVVDVPVGTVMSRLSRARQRLRAALSEAHSDHD